MTMAKEPAGDDARPVSADPETDEELQAPGATDDTHTAALQGAAGGGAAAGSAGYATGLLTGSEDAIGLRDIPDDDEKADAGREAGRSTRPADVTPPSTD